MIMEGPFNSKFRQFWDKRQVEQFERQLGEVRSSLRSWLSHQFVESLYLRATDPDAGLRNRFDLSDMQRWVRSIKPDYPATVLVEAIADLCTENCDLIVQTALIDDQAKSSFSNLSISNHTFGKNNIFKIRQDFQSICSRVLTNYIDQNLPVAEQTLLPDPKGRLVITGIELHSKFDWPRQIAASGINLETKIYELGDCENVVQLRNCLDLLVEYIQIRTDLLEGYAKTGPNQALVQITQSKFKRTGEQIRSLCQALDLQAGHSREPSANSATTQDYFKIYGISQELSTDWRKEYARIETNNLSDLIQYTQNLCYYTQRLDGLLVQLGDPKGSPRDTLNGSLREFESSMQSLYNPTHLKELETKVDLAKTEVHGGYIPEDFIQDFTWIGHTENAFRGRINDQILEIKERVAPTEELTYSTLAKYFLITVSEVAGLASALQESLNQFGKPKNWNQQDYQIVIDLLKRLQESKTTGLKSFNFQYSFLAEEIHASDVVRRFFSNRDMVKTVEELESIKMFGLLPLAKKSEKQVVRFSGLTQEVGNLVGGKYQNTGLAKAVTSNSSFLEIRCLSSGDTINKIDLLDAIRKSAALERAGIFAYYQDPVRYIQGWYFLRDLLHYVHWHTRYQ